MAVYSSYLSKIKPNQVTLLNEIIDIVQQVCPSAEQVMTYGMPGFKYKGKYLVAFGAFKNHISIYPGSEIIADLKDELRQYKTSKGAIQFSNNQKIPKILVETIVKLRLGNLK